ncbi:hypothetical protein [Klebsiella pneumoniae]|uniref:hypothetical protein n=1 Tax=Klebsiella pneumoniae TaxID=573 RepID=UPI000F619C6B|nr:hypothetical protein [Klebsiella pneumoniae]RRF43525.1 hypothetical protein EAO12_29795 [Klebsiella pneumoniae]
MAQADLDRAKKSMSGDTPKLSTQTKTGDRIKLITDNAGKKVGDFVNPDTGEALRDLSGM